MSQPCATCGKPLAGIDRAMVCTGGCRVYLNHLLEQVAQGTQSETLREECDEAITRNDALPIYQETVVEELTPEQLEAWGRAHNVINTPHPLRGGISRCPACGTRSNLIEGSRCVQLVQFVPPVRCQGVLVKEKQTRANDA
jgi:hypothetical protein